MAFTTSGQETEWAYSYSPGAHTGLHTADMEKTRQSCLVCVGGVTEHNIPHNK